jgi:hypothetical protein
MGLEHLTQPAPMMEICPENSRFGMRWNAQKREFYICKKGDAVPIVTLGYDEGKYMYACLRGQQRIEELGKMALDIGATGGVLTKSRWMRDMSTSGLNFEDADLQAMWGQLCAQSNSVVLRGGENPAITHSHLYRGAEAFVHTEDAEVRQGYDMLPRAQNRIEDCHIAAKTYLQMLGKEPSVAEAILQKISTYEKLAVYARAPRPVLVEIASRDHRHNALQGLKKSALLKTHSCIVFASVGDEHLVFEKVGHNLPWRLTTLRDVYAMYEKDFKSANSGVPTLFWTVSEVEDVRRVRML